MQPNILAQKAQTRKELRATARALSPLIRQQADVAITAQVLSHPAWQTAHTIFLFVSMGTEPNTTLLLQTALAQGKRVCVPLCLQDGIMEARQITSFSQLTPKQYGILAPDDCCPLIAPSEMDLVLAPCVGTSLTCQRMGNGGGYYDRFFPQVHCPVYCLCRGALLLPELPIEPHDFQLHGIFTEHGLHLSQ